jgi:rhomboid protease GluP
VRLTQLLIAANAVAFLWLVVDGGLGAISGAQPSVFYLVHGALLGTAVTDYGEWWRLFSAAFLHGSLVHIGVNMFALYQVGALVERLMGPLRYASLYLLATAGSGAAVVWFNHDQVTLGASGAIFGLFGALVAIGLSLRPRGMSLVTGTLPVIGVNLAFGFLVPGISNAAHIGGLITGFVTGWLLYQVPSARREAAYAAVNSSPASPVAVPQAMEDDARVETIEQPPDAGPHEEEGAPPLEVRDPRE